MHSDHTSSCIARLTMIEVTVSNKNVFSTRNFPWKFERSVEMTDVKNAKAELARDTNQFDDCELGFMLKIQIL